MNNYEEKQQRKLERYQELASKNARASVSSWEASNRAVAGIPFGQPILVGHHSEKAHRRALERSWSAMGKSIELSEKAEHYEDKVQNILNPRAISSDDPDAIQKLKAEIESLKQIKPLFLKYEKEIWESFSKLEQQQDLNTIKSLMHKHQLHEVTA